LKGYVWNFIRLLRKIGILNKIKTLICLQLKNKIYFFEREREKQNGSITVEALEKVKSSKYI